MPATTKTRMVQTAGRSRPEWIGKTPNSRPPLSVKLRVFAAYDGRCYLSKLKIGVGDEWDVEHIRPLHLARPGENLNRETNLAPALKRPHAEKTAAENTARAKCDRIRAKHLGIYPESPTPLRSRNTFRKRGPRA